MNAFYSCGLWREERGFASIRGCALYWQCRERERGTVENGQREREQSVTEKVKGTVQ